MKLNVLNDMTVRTWRCYKGSPSIGLYQVWHTQIRGQQVTMFNKMRTNLLKGVPLGGVECPPPACFISRYCTCPRHSLYTIKPADTTSLTPTSEAIFNIDPRTTTVLTFLCRPDFVTVIYAFFSWGRPFIASLPRWPSCVGWWNTAGKPMTVGHKW